MRTKPTLTKAQVYEFLEEKMLRYADLVGVPVAPSAEKLVKLEADEDLQILQIDERMKSYTGEDIYVRLSVASLLKKTAKSLRNYSPDLQLQVVYGYRALEIQKSLFLQFKQAIAKKYPSYDEQELLEAIHRLIAVPEVSGHPTGGAVDVQILVKGKPVDMGTKIWEFVEDTYTFSPFISKEAWQNRQLLRRVMLNSGFAPFDGEWWHFSYGDREWAKYYNRGTAIYAQVDFKS